MVRFSVLHGHEQLFATLQARAAERRSTATRTHPRAIAFGRATFARHRSATLKNEEPAQKEGSANDRQTRNSRQEDDITEAIDSLRSFPSWSHDEHTFDKERSPHE